MKTDIVESIISDASDLLERDISRFERMNRDKKTANLLCVIEEGGVKATFSEHGNIEEVVCLDINFVDSNGVVHALTQDNSTLRSIFIFFPSNRRILAAYEILDKPGTNFCSWGYKNSSAHTEKLFIYFKTKCSAYMACVDAQHPEYQFFLLDDDWENYNSVQNLHQFLKSLIGRAGDRHEHFS